MRRQQNRNAGTMKMVSRRIRDAELDLVPDPRAHRGRRFQWRALLSALVLGATVISHSLRAVEDLTADLAPPVRRRTGIPTRISDTKLRDVVRSLSPGDIRACLHRQVKAEHRRARLKATRLPLGTVALDGKGLGKTESWDHADIQAVKPKGRSGYGLARVHRWTLVSSQAAVCLDERPIPGGSNEIGEAIDATRELLDTYGRTGLVELITADAGNTSQEHARFIHGRNIGYFFAIKENHGDIYLEAIRVLASLGEKQAEWSVTERQKGKHITYRLYRAPLKGGYLAWNHARQLVRLERIVTNDAGEVEVQGNRYFVTNLPSGRLKACQLALLVRMHWRCENEGHWVSDAIWKEDARRTPWTKEPQAIFVVSLIRKISMNIVVMARAMSRREYVQGQVSFRQVRDDIYVVLRSGMGVPLNRCDMS